jgi:hypothetical protein
MVRVLIEVCVGLTILWLGLMAHMGTLPLIWLVWAMAPLVIVMFILSLLD